ncbi:MAG TPA: hypothetical protein VGN01_09455 [Acidobacteriaceae bacterium]
MITRRAGLMVLAAVVVGMVVVDLRLPPIPQPLSYHQFADQRSWLGIPNFGDVVSNIPFAIVGLLGLVFVLGSGQERLERCFVDGRERAFYVILFAGLVLTAFGSSYYHLHPDNARLVWDRLPMTIVFMSLIAALVAERISLSAGLRLLPVLLLIGAGSVMQWYWSEMRGAGDLRFYATVQAFSVVFLLVALLFSPRYTRGADLVVVAGFYVLAKALETYDRQVFRALHVVSGHTLKHLAAACAGFWILRMLEKRRPIAGSANQ